jgi:hypothetical protein
MALAQISAYLSESHTPDRIIISIASYLTQWFEPTYQAQDLDTTDLNKMSRVIYKQNLMGWRKFMRERLLIDWGNMINKNLDSKNIAHHNAEKWGVKLVCLHWKYIPKILD